MSLGLVVVQFWMGTKCKKCGSIDEQIKRGRTRSGSHGTAKSVIVGTHQSQNCTNEKTKELAVRAYLHGNSARGTGFRLPARALVQHF